MSNVMLMAKNDEKTALRLPSSMRRQIEQLITEGKYKNLSQVIRAALADFLNQGGIDDAPE
jgi:Arc/MetJ-type ribon-helix-helix transcriptional regulator